MTESSLREFVAHHDDRWLFVAVYIGLAVVLSIALSLFWLVAVAGLHFVLEYLRQAQHRHGRREVVSHALWEIKLDVALVLLALAMALYMDVILGVLGLQSAARATAATRAGMRATRFAAWERNIRALVLMADDVARMIQVGVTRWFRRAPAGTEARPVLEAATIDHAAAAAAGAAADAARRGPPPIEAAALAGAAFRTAPAAPSAAARRTARAAPAGNAPRSWRDAWSRGDRFTVALLLGSAALIVLAPVFTTHSWGGATLALLEQLHPFPPR